MIFYTRIFLASCVCGSFFLPDADSAQVKLPKGFIQCKQKDPKFNKCVLGAIQSSVPELVKGQPKFGIPPVDPLRIDSLYIDQGQGSVIIKLNFTNLDIIGLAKSVIETVQVDPQTATIQVKTRVSKPLILNGTYVVSGKVLVLPISGNGHSKLVLDGFTAFSTLNFQPKEKNGDTYWSLEKTDFNFNTTKLHINLENLFNGNKELGDNMNTFLNENWQLLLDELRPAFRNALKTIYGSYVQRFFDRVPITRIFPTQ